ncbi:MAG: hypothetical protein ONB44_12080 [candidate division KSB1 bacterium]|nr:hypothetical protein [candidate division KSB1 bacterium]MDZ7302858.1 hypothetical protein [candidate division KSB1 bacterium]MDZ7311875.1 hypothetical protein [candidate division KSB1 bacterium]
MVIGESERVALEIARGTNAPPSRSFTNSSSRVINHGLLDIFATGAARFCRARLRKVVPLDKLRWRGALAGIK